jgi:hypothetical protein
MRATLLHTFVIVGLVSIGASTAFGAGRAGGPVPMTPALKMDMANMYQKMADCLRTGKSVELCSKEVEKDCPVVKKTGHCPLMEGMTAVTSGKE